MQILIEELEKMVCARMGIGLGLIMAEEHARCDVSHVYVCQCSGDRKPSDDIDGGHACKPTLHTVWKSTCNFRKHGSLLVTMADVGNIENVPFVLELKT